MNTELIESIKIIESKGGPKWYEWVISLNGTPGIIELNASKQMILDESDYVFNRPACESAVIAWAGEVQSWWNQREANSSNLAPYGEVWHWFINASYYSDGSREPTQYAACVALIHAVAKELGE